MARANRVPPIPAEYRPEAISVQEREFLMEFDRLLEVRQDGTHLAVRIGDQEIEVPRFAEPLLHDFVHALARGDAVEVLPREQVLTTQEAAAILNVSRPTLVRLLDQGTIPSTRVGGSEPGAHRRVRLEAVRAYQKQREAENVARVGRLVTLTEDLGLYDEE